jgi:hypothetical protein
MNLMSLVLAPVRVPLRLARALDDLAAIAERARRDPDPVEVARERLDLALDKLDALLGAATEIVAVGHSVVRTGLVLDSTGRDLHSGGEDLTAVSKAIEADTRTLIDGGEDLTAVSERLDAHLRVFRMALPRLLQLEDAVETVADTVEPLQGATERLGRFVGRRRD